MLRNYKSEVSPVLDSATIGLLLCGKIKQTQKSSTTTATLSKWKSTMAFHSCLAPTEVFSQCIYELLLLPPALQPVMPACILQSRDSELAQSAILHVTPQWIFWDFCLGPLFCLTITSWKEKFYITKIFKIFTIERHQHFLYIPS